MSKLLLALVLAASTDALAHDGSDDERDARDRRSCSVDVSVVDARGRLRDARRVSASTVPSVVIEGRIARRGRDDDEEEAPKLLFDVYNPRGRRYQVLLATPPRASKGDGRQYFWRKPAPPQQATLAVAGSSITLTSMYGVWRVEPRLEGDRQACGRPEYFTIRP
jgi:hypothetical protein